MPKNKGKGGSSYRKGKKNNLADEDSRPLELKQEGQEYAKVLKMLGNRRIHAICNDGTKRLCIIPGKMRFREWIAPDDIILLGIRDYQNDKADVIYKYTNIEAKKLSKKGELGEFLLNEDKYKRKNKETEDIIFVQEDEENNEELTIDDI